MRRRGRGRIVFVCARFGLGVRHIERYRIDAIANQMGELYEMSAVFPGMTLSGERVPWCG